MSDVPIGDQIASFYERHPYPPPVDDLEAYRRSWTDERRRQETLRLWPDGSIGDARTILVAGCGTSQAAKYAVRYPHARIVGIDVSERSIAENRRLVDHHGLANIELHRLPIEQVAQLGATFDHVVSTGVLHHLAEPAAGFAALASVIAPGGALEAMVYAPYGRTGVYMLQEYCRLLGVQPTIDDIAELVEALRELPLGHPLGHLLRSTPDFADDDALADALLNPRDHAYAVDEVLGLIDQAGLRFSRWVRQAPYLPACGSMSDLAHRRRIETLSITEQYAAMELFRGTMVRHSFIAHLADDPIIDVRFDEWRRLVPARSTTSIAVTERVPAPWTAALLNQAHTDRDLVLFATDEQHRVFQAIDGQRSCGDLGADRTFFERLWQHDLIVVDTSNAPTT
jgi:SAM-dependent methyltransferase